MRGSLLKNVTRGIIGKGDVVRLSVVLGLGASYFWGVVFDRGIEEALLRIVWRHDAVTLKRARRVNRRDRSRVCGLVKVNGELLKLDKRDHYGSSGVRWKVDHCSVAVRY